jgi:hypothetical protein
MLCERAAFAADFAACYDVSLEQGLTSERQPEPDFFDPYDRSNPIFPTQ